MAKIQERIKTDYKAMEASRGEAQQCSVCHIRYRSHEVQPLCSDCEEQQQQTAQSVVVERDSLRKERNELESAQQAVEDAPVVETSEINYTELTNEQLHTLAFGDANDAQARKEYQRRSEAFLREEAEIRERLMLRREKL